MDQSVTSNGSKQDQWIIRIRNNLAQALERDEVQEQSIKETPVTIFAVPKLLAAGKPEAYVPQHVAIGPYHQGSPQLTDMEKYKLEAATRSQHKLVGDLRFEDMVANLVKLDGRVRGSYHRYLDVSDENLAWVTAIDASFLLEYLQGLIGVDSGDAQFGAASTVVSRALDHFVMRDIIMLENQIPSFVLGEILSLQNDGNSEELLKDMLLALCALLCPFKRGGKVASDKAKITARAHLLEAVYFHTLPNQDFLAIDVSLSSKETDSIKSDHQSVQAGRDPPKKPNLLRIFSGKLFRIVLPFILRKFAKLVSLMGTIAKRRSQLNNAETSLRKLSTSRGMSIAPIDAGPTTEELLVPSIAELNNVGVKFINVPGDISDIKFDPVSARLSLPTITLDHNSDVVLRNMVAYEAVASHGSLVLARYVELMNGMIDTEEDVWLLREAGVVVSHMKNDEEVAGMWNGMGRSLRLTKVGGMDTVIAELNKFYEGSWKTKAERVANYVYGWWPMLTLLAANLIILITSLQAFCTLYNCKRTKLHN